MIVVIADDLTGAVEIGGIGLAFGLKVRVDLYEINAESADLLILSTDSRSGSGKSAIKITEDYCESLKSLKSELVYKKIDSVLRGHIVLETRTHLEKLGIKKALLIPANPASGRVISDGNYLINGLPIHQTSFSKDPEFPAHASDIQSLLRSNDIAIKKCTEDLIDGINIAELNKTDELENWLSKVNDGVLIGGGSAFFKSLLKSRFKDNSLQNSSEEPLHGKTLLVSGTAYNESVALIDSYYQSNNVIYVPESLLYEELESTVVSGWVQNVIAKLTQSDLVLIAFKSESKQHVDALLLRETIAMLIQLICAEIEISELIIEGGSTASAILRALNIQSVYPVNEFAPGIVRNRAGNNSNLHITLKPGSYPWPKNMWQSIEKKMDL